MLKNYADVKIFIASILIFINFAPLKPSKRQTKKTIDMKKTLLSALKHGSGIIFVLLTMILGGGLQAWGYDARGKTIYFVPNSTWKNNGATFCLYYFYSSDNSKNGWVSMTEIGSSTGYYSAVIPSDAGFQCDRFVFIRKSSSVSCAFDNAWNQTTDQNYTTNNTYKINGNKSGDKYLCDQTFSRYYSAGEYIYLQNIIPDGWSAKWITSSHNYSYIYMKGGSAGAHTYRFSRVSGEEYAEGAVYGAQVTNAGTYEVFRLVRADSSCSDGSHSCADNETGETGFDATKNYITGGYGNNTTSVTWDMYYPCDNPTVTTTSSPSTTAVSAACAGTYSTGGDYCAPISGGIAYKKGSDDYSDQAGTVSAGAISASLSGLIPGTTYTYKAYIVLDNSTRIEGSEQTFTTGCPTITITGQPSESPVSYCSGAAISALSVTATSSPDYTMEYQWYSSSDKSSDSTISGATESSYTPSSGTLYYRCKVRTNSACDASAETSEYSGLVTFDPSKVSPVITASETNVTNYIPVTLTATGASISTWTITSGSGVNQYMYKETGTSAIFKGNVGSGSAVTYTITGTTANDCSSAVNVTVNSDSDICQ